MWNSVVVVPAAPSGQGTVEVVSTAKSLTHIKTVYKVHLQVYRRWVYPRIVQRGASCKLTDVDSFFFPGECKVTMYWYNWRGDSHGGLYVKAEVDVENCINLPFLNPGCWANAHVTLEIYVNGNGAWLRKSNGKVVRK